MLNNWRMPREPNVMLAAMAATTSSQMPHDRSRQRPNAAMETRPKPKNAPQRQRVSGKPDEGRPQGAAIDGRQSVIHAARPKMMMR